MESRKLLIYFALKYKGDWESIYEALKSKEEPEDEEVAALLKTMTSKAITFLDDEYPESLKSIYRPPFVLFYHGNINLLDCKMKSIAVVGARDCTTYGIECTCKLVKDLCKNLTIVSGLARGIDLCAHACALKYKGKTIGVLGSGINRIYPDSSEKIYNIMKKTQLVISEYPEDTEPTLKTFPVRNRIVAGLTNVALIPEARMISGSSITAGMVLRNGGYVCCCPDRMGNNSLCNHLIKNGACLVETAEDIYEEAGIKIHQPVFKSKNS